MMTGPEYIHKNRRKLWLNTIFFSAYLIITLTCGMNHILVPISIYSEDCPTSFDGWLHIFFVSLIAVGIAEVPPEFPDMAVRRVHA